MDQASRSLAASPGGPAVAYRLSVYTQPLQPPKLHSQQGGLGTSAGGDFTSAAEPPHQQGALSGGVQAAQLQCTGSSAISAVNSADWGAALLLQQQLSVRPLGTSAAGTDISDGQLQAGSKCVLDAAGATLLRVASGNSGSQRGALLRPSSYRERAAAAENAALEEEINAIQVWECVVFPVKRSLVKRSRLYRQSAVHHTTVL